MRKTCTPLTEELRALVCSPAFIEANGDWRKGRSSLLLDGSGEPKVYWHGSSRAFDSFDFSRAGDNTGLVTYRDHVTGADIPSDSLGTVFFTDSRELAVSYAFLARTKELTRLSRLLTEVRAFVYSGGSFVNRTVRDADGLRMALDAFAGSGDEDLGRLAEDIGSGAVQADREGIVARLDAARRRYGGYCDANRIGGLSNELNNIVRQVTYLPSFVESLGRLCRNDATVRNEFGDFTGYNQSFFSGGRHGATVFFEDGHAMVSGFRERPVRMDGLSPADLDELVSCIRSGLESSMAAYNGMAREAGYLDAVHLYPVFLKAGKPLVHDYAGSSFPDTYLSNSKFPTAYVAARQARKARRDGCDAVVYENVRDPFLSTSVGVFSEDQIVRIDGRAMGLDMSAALDLNTFLSEERVSAWRRAERALQVLHDGRMRVLDSAAEAGDGALSFSYHVSGPGGRVIRRDARLRDGILTLSADGRTIGRVDIESGRLEMEKDRRKGMADRRGRGI